MLPRLKRVMIVAVVGVLLSVTIFSCAHNAEAMRKAGKIARIGTTGEEIRHIEIEWILSLMPPNIKNRYDNPEGRAHLFHDLVRFYLFRNEAFRLGFDENRGSHIEAENIVITRIAAMYRQHITNNILIPESELVAFYNSNKSNYKITPDGGEDTLQHYVFDYVRERVLLDYLLSERKAEIDAVFANNKALFQRPARIDVSHIFATSRSTLVEAQNKLNAGSSFGEVVSSHSQDTTTINREGHLGTYLKGVAIWGVEESDTLFNTLFGMEKGRYSDIIKTSRGYHIFKLNNKQDAYMPSEEEKNIEAANMYLRHVRDSLSRHYFDSLKAWFPIKTSLHLFDSTALGIEEYFNNNKEDFISEKRVVTSITVDNWDKGRYVVDALNRGANFDSLLKAVAVGERTYGPSFEENFKFPEIGREAFKLHEVGDISREFKTDLGFHVIRLDSIITGIQKPFDVAKDSVYQRVFVNALVRHKDSVLLQVGDIKMTVGDYHRRAQTKDEMEYVYYMLENMQRIVENMSRDYYYYADAVRNGFLKNERVAFIANYIRSSFWASVYEKSHINRYHGLKPSVVHDYYEKNKNNFLDGRGNVLPLDEDLITEIAAKKILTDEVLRNAYNNNLERYVSAGTLLDFEAVRERVFDNHKFEELHRHKIEYYKTLFKEYNVVFFDPAFIPRVLIDEKGQNDEAHVLAPETVDSLWAQADSALLGGKPAEAMSIYRQIIDRGGKSERVVDAHINLGRLEQDRGRFGEAYRLFNVVLKEHPRAGKNDRVLFLMGYLFFDRLNRKDLANAYFQRVVEEYPKSELRDDAEVLMDPERLKQLLQR